MNYGAYGLTTRAQEGLVYTGETVGRAVSVPASAAAVTKLLSAAGVGASAGPVGWVVAGGMALAAAVLSLVSMIKNRNLREAQAVQVAQQLGLPGAASVPAWIFEALSMGKYQRQREAEKLQKKLARGGTLGNPVWDIQTKLSVLGILDLMDMATARMEAGLSPLPPSPQLIQDTIDRANRMETNAKIAEYLRYGVLLGGLGLVAYVLFSD